MPVPTVKVVNVDIDETMHEPATTARPHQAVGHVHELMTNDHVSALPAVNTDEQPKKSKGRT